MASVARAILTLLVTATFVIVAIALRIRQILARSQRKVRRAATDKAHLLIVLGSGGHTAEMLAMLDRATTNPPATPASSASQHSPIPLWHRFTHRTWVISSGDAISALRAHGFESTISQRLPTPISTMEKESENPSTYTMHTVPRARAIHQPLSSTPMSALRCARICLAVLLSRSRTSSPPDPPLAQQQGMKPQEQKHDLDLPDLILCNGPATATILVFVALWLRFWNVRGAQSRGKLRVVYVESWARVRKLSLSGRLLCWVADRFLVQWPGLQGQGRAEFVGVLV